MTKLTTFQRATAVSAPEAPEPHTPGPFVRHGVMVRDTTETTGGMFCVRSIRETESVTGRPMRAYGDAIGYAYSHADANLFAAAPSLLASLRKLVAECNAHLDYEEDEDMSAAVEAAEDAIAAAEGRS